MTDQPIRPDAVIIPIRRASHVHAGQLVDTITERLVALDLVGRRIRVAADDVGALDAIPTARHLEELDARIAQRGREVMALADELWRVILGTAPPFDPEWTYAEVDR